MKIRAKIDYRFQERSGINQSTGNAWRNQDIKLRICDENWNEKNDTILVRCGDVNLLDAPAMVQGSTGIASLWCNVSEYNGRAYNNFTLSAWAPQQVAAPQAPTPEQPQAPAPQQPAQEHQAPAPQQEATDDLPF